MKKPFIFIGIIVFGTLVLSGVAYVSSLRDKERKVSQVQRDDKADLQQTETLLLEGKPQEALEIIKKNEGRITLKTDSGIRWLNLLMEALSQTDNYKQMMAVYEAYPIAFENNEKASITVGQGYILSQAPQEYEKIRDDWKGRMTLPDIWFILDADALVVEGRQSEAIQLLKSKKLKGKFEIERLLRLARLTATRDPKEAWGDLAEAYSLDPKNTAVLSARAKLLESMGETRVALYEYISAIQAKPESIELKDLLAEYYMRHNQPALALSIWLGLLTKPAPDAIWIKAIFWSKMATPIWFDWKKAAPPSGPDKAFIDYLLSLPQGTFWNEEAFKKVAGSNQFLINLDVTFWLRLLEFLKEEKKKNALNLLIFNQFSTNSLNPELEKALHQILNYQLFGSFIGKDSEPYKKEEEKVDAPNSTALNFFAQLNSLAEKESQGKLNQELSVDLKALLESDEVFSATFLAAGWLEAALQLHKLEKLPDDFPEWVAYGLTQALRINRSTEEAIKFALEQKKTPALSVLIGELYIAEKAPQKALPYLEPYLHSNGNTGYRASWLASIAYVDQNELEKAKSVIQNNSTLAKEPLGIEGLARIALLQGNEAQASSLYAQIADQSPEAMSFLARKAFAEKNWNRALELTEKLIVALPDNVVLRDNLQKIKEKLAEGDGTNKK